MKAPAASQRLVQQVSGALIPHVCLGILDDIAIHGCTVQKQNERLNFAVERPRGTGLPSHKILFQRVRGDDDKIAKVANQPTSNNA